MPKRIFLANILYTLLYCISATAAVNYSPSHESVWCEAAGFLLQYSGTLVIVHYGALGLALVFQVTVPVYQAVRKKHENIYSPRKAKLWEAMLFLLLFLCPLLNSWEPFLPQLPSYGNNGPSCWFSLNLIDNCTTNNSDGLFLRTIPFAVACFGCCLLTLMVSLALCCTYCKFRTKTVGSHIITVIPAVVVMTFVSFMMMVWFIIQAATTSSQIESLNFSTWLRNVTVITASTVGILVLAGVYIHFPTPLCLHSKRALDQGGQNEQQIVHPPEVAYHNTQPAITPHPPNVDHHTYHTHTICDIPHSPVTTEYTPLISTHPPEVDHRKYHTHKICDIPHSAVTTEYTPLISTHPPEVDHHKYPTHTTCSISHEPVTTNHI